MPVPRCLALFFSLFLALTGSEATTNSAPGWGAIGQVVAAQKQFAAGSLSSQRRSTVAGALAANAPWLTRITTF